MPDPDRIPYILAAADHIEDGTASPEERASLAAVARDYCRLLSAEGPVKAEDDLPRKLRGVMN